MWTPQTSKQEEQQRDLLISQLVTNNLISLYIKNMAVWFTEDEYLYFAFTKHQPYFCTVVVQHSGEFVLRNIKIAFEDSQLRYFIWCHLCRVKCLCPQRSLLVGQCRIAVDNFVFRSVWPPQGLTNHFLPESPWLTHFLIANEVLLLRF